MDTRVTEFPIAEAKARFSELVDRAGNGESITIKRHGKPVAKLVPLTRLPLTVEERRKSTEDWIAYRKAHNITLGPGLTTKDLINEGRKY